MYFRRKFSSRRYKPRARPIRSSRYAKRYKPGLKKTPFRKGASLKQRLGIVNLRRANAEKQFSNFIKKIRS